MTEAKRYYFIGIGGIGMSALARYVAAAGAAVAGYDRTPSPLTAQLEAEGMRISYSDTEADIPTEFRSIDDELLVVRTPAVPSDNQVLSYFRAVGARIVKRSEFLAAIAASKTCLAVAGTHGKTTTSSILAHIMATSSLGCTAFVGGIMTGYQSNVIIDTDSPYVVLEADEFDRSFHHLAPQQAIVTSTDADHLDIYDAPEAFQQAFQDFAMRVLPDGLLLHHAEVRGLETKASSRDYGIAQGELRAESVVVKDGRFHFDIVGTELQGLSLPLPGRHNVLNALAACGIALELGVRPDEIRAAFASYGGVKRRFEFIHQDAERVYIDDYAHHPTEIQACISSVRELYPGKKVTVIFQPHLFSRTRDFMDGFAESLSLADELILLPIYPARELPIAGVDSQALLSKVGLTNKLLCEKGEVPARIAAAELEVLLTLGAGDIDRLVPLIHKEFTQKANA